jgi:hypothetical protein
VYVQASKRFLLLVRGRGGRGRRRGAAQLRPASAMDGSRKRKIETRGAEAAEEEQRKKLQLKLGKVHCNYCKRDVSDQMYIKSAVPVPPRPAPPRPAPPRPMQDTNSCVDRGDSAGARRCRTMWICAFSASRWGRRSTT